MEKTQEAESDNGEVKAETKALNDGSLCGYDSLHSLLSANLKPELFQTVAPTFPLNNLPSFENMECSPVVVPCFRRIEIVGTKEEPTATGTREIFDLWFPASAIDEKDLNRFSSYAQTVIKRYNRVKKTDFEFVRLVTMRWTLGHFYLRFKARSSGAGPGATLKTFEGDVRCNLCLVNEEDGRPLSCRLIGRNFDDYLCVRPPPWYH